MTTPPPTTEPAHAVMPASERPDMAVLGEQAVALEALTARAKAHEHAARSPRTRALYAADWAHFTGWCDLIGQAALPAQVDTVRLYLTDLEAACDADGARLYQPATLARRLAAIAAMHKDTGHRSPTLDPRVRAVLSGISRTRQHAPRRMRPLLLADLRAIFTGLDYQSWPTAVSATRDTFALLAGFAGALRRSELAALTVADLAWHTSDGLYLRIRASKTDQQGHGATVVLPFGAHPGTCPPCAWLRWARLLQASRRGRLELMRAVFTTPPWTQWTHQCGTPTTLTPHQADPAATNPSHTHATQGHDGITDRHDSAPNFAPESTADSVPGFANPVADATGLPADTALLCSIRKGGTLAGTPITGDGLHVMVKRRTQAAGLPGPIGFHSLRAGFVTQARRAGAGTRAVRRQTRHSSDAMVEIYDRDHAPLLGNAVLDLGL